MANPTAAMLVIGDEILSGRTQDANTHHLAQELTKAGIDLREVRVVPDVQSEIVDAVNALRRKYTHVFTSGGIGPTHDDITADSIAAAFGVPIGVRADARDLLASNYAGGMAEMTEARLRMARIPEGAELIVNAISKAPGFSMENVHVMAGVPAIFVVMLEVLLPGLTHGQPVLSRTIRLDAPESQVADTLADIARAFPALSIGSYPFSMYGKYGTNIVVRGTDKTLVDDAAMAVNVAFDEAVNVD
jgi:molybdenum cofactor synthesis domain-containing protein